MVVSGTPSLVSGGRAARAVLRELDVPEAAGG